MADSPEDGSVSTEIAMDGNRVVEALRSAGLQPEKLDIAGVLGDKNLDVEELQSRLRAAGTGTAARWEVRVVVRF